MVIREGPGLRSETVRRANLSAIVRALHDRGPLSRSELVACTGLTRSAIWGLVGELVAEGLAAEEPAKRLGTPGRPSPRVRLIPNAAVVLAMEIAVDSLAVAVIGLGGLVFQMLRVDAPRGHRSPDAIVDELVRLARTVRAARPTGDRLIGIGVAVVGVVRRSDGQVFMAPNLGWRDVALGERLARAFPEGVPISVANEADLGALAEHRRGSAIGESNVLFISGEVGVGGGVIVDGRPLTGVAGYGGEVGHFPVNPDGKPCRCGSVGCWETEIGEDALLVRAGHPAGSGREGVDAVVSEAAAGSPVALAALDEVGRWLGVGLAGFVNVFNPGCVVLGGVFRRAYPFLSAAMERELRQRALGAARALVRVVPGALDIGAPLIGAAELAFETLLVNPTARVGLADARTVLASA